MIASPFLRRAAEFRGAGRPVSVAATRTTWTRGRRAISRPTTPAASTSRASRRFSTSRKCDRRRSRSRDHPPRSFPSRPPNSYSRRTSCPWCRTILTCYRNACYRSRPRFRLHLRSTPPPRRSSIISHGTTKTLFPSSRSCNYPTTLRAA